MQADFWHRRWHKNEIGFHESQGNHLLKSYFDKLVLKPGARVFVPLCGKTRDIAWLLAKGHNVVGIELNNSAVLQLFEDLGLTDKFVLENDDDNKSGLKHYHYTFPNGLMIDIYQGDFFTLTAQRLGNIEAVFDRAALVALPPAMREQYVTHLLKITHCSPQLLVCYQYEEGVIQGPPHSVESEEVSVHYQNLYCINNLYTNKVEGGFREQSEVFESAYLLEPRSGVNQN